MAVHTTLASALADLDAFNGAPQDFTLSIDESLLDPAGFSMALVTDKILAKGWTPDGRRTSSRLPSLPVLPRLTLSGQELTLA